MAVGGIAGAAGIGGGSGWSGGEARNITISEAANVSAAGGIADNDSGFVVCPGVAIGNGAAAVMHGKPNAPAEVAANTTGLTTGSITYYVPGTTAAAIAEGTATVVGDDPTNSDPVVPDPVNPDPVNPNNIVPVPVNPDPIVINPSSDSDNNSVSVEAQSAPLDADAAFFAAVDMQIEELLNRISALIAEGRLDEINALIANGFSINVGSHRGFNAATLAQISKLSSMGIAVTVNFIYEGNSYSITIPANSTIDLSSLVDASGYCEFINMVKYFG